MRSAERCVERFMKRKKRNVVRKGVSEVIGYLLLFSIVVAVVGVIYTSGIPMVEQTKETSALQSMETAFLSLQSNIKKVAFGQSPVRTMKFNLVKGSISVNETAGNITVNITVNGQTIRQTIQFGNIEYVLGSRKIVYENGAVIECFSGGCVIVSDPPMFFVKDSEGNAHVFISVINVSGKFSAGGGVAEMQISLLNSTRDIHVYNSSSSVSSVNISIKSFKSSSYARAWSLFLNRSYEKAFGKPPSDAGCSGSSCWLNVNKNEISAKNLNFTLVTHNVTIS